MYKRIVIKVGSAVLAENGRLAEPVVRHIVGDIEALHAEGVEVILVSSGAVVTGRGILPAVRAKDTVAEKQVFAAVGQVGLMSTYARLFGEKQLHCAQVLVTKEDFRDRQHYGNMKSCFENLLREKVVPIVNENDAIAVTELLFTDNDELAGLIASQLDADAVIFLTSVAGVMAGGSLVSDVTSKTIASVELHITEERSASGRGGMRTKFAIAKRLMAEGIASYIASGRERGVILDIAAGKPAGTKFVPDKKLPAAKRRLAHAEGFASGAAYVNKCAVDVLRSEKAASLLPVGIVKVTGSFKRGDVIEVKDENGAKIGFGIAQYDSEKAAEAAGKKGARALIHYDYLFIG